MNNKKRVTEQKVSRGYRIDRIVYDKALEKSRQQKKGTLSSRIEKFVTKISES